MPQQPLKILQASAGSGKTFSLTAHYLTLVLSSENKYREILAVTFTNKATEEMKTRIMEVLKGFAEGDASKKIGDYREIVLRAHPDLSAEELKLKADVIYRKILHDYNRFSVSTIDGFVQKVIRGFAFELGLDAGYGLEMNYDKVKAELADRLDKALDKNPVLLQWIIDLALDRINNNLSWNYRRELINLTDEIFKERYQPFENAVKLLGEHADIDLLFKEYNKITRLGMETFESGVKELAAQALEVFQVEGIDVSSLKGKSRSPLMGLQKIVEGDFSKINSLLKLVDQPEEWFQKGQDNASYYQINPIVSKLVATYQEGLAGYVLAQAFNKNLYYLRLMQEMASLLKEYRNDSPNLLISDAQTLLKGITDDANDNPSFIWEKMGNRYRNFLFDEFQDTSSNQWHSFKSLLTNAIASPSGKLIDHLIVGDTKQSIYRWRNGDWNILHQQAKNDVKIHNVIEDSLAENYRSTKNIIGFNNDLFKRLPPLMQTNINGLIEEAEAKDVEHWWKEKGFDHIVTDVYAESEQKITPFTLEGGTISFNVLKDDGEGGTLTKTGFMSLSLVKMIAEIDQLINLKQYKPRDICVLVRSNSEAVAAVETLMDYGVDVISGEALLLSNNSAVKLILNTLQVMGGLAENTALYKANCLSLYAKLQHRTVSPEHYFGLKAKGLTDLSGLLPEDLCQHWQAWMQQPLPALLEKIIESYGLHEQVFASNLPYLFALRDLAGRFAQQGERGIAAFLSYWEEEGLKKTLPSSENTDAVQVITIHKSKGLAFRAVMLPFCNWDINGKPNGIFWVPAEGTPYHHLNSIPLKYGKELGRSTVAKPYFEELLYNNMDALNMVYVATTRAKEYLYISTMGKKTDTVTNIGDLLFRVFRDDLDEDGRLIKDEPVPVLPEKEIYRNEIEMESYPVSDRLSQVFDSNLKRRDIDFFTGESAGRTGTILHEVLARAADVKEVDTVLESMLLEGVFKEVELSSLKAQARSVLNHSGLQEILSLSKESLNEKSIIDADGKSYRPDKVLVKGSHITIVDYKFTQQESDAHIAQVSHYKSLLMAMGYTDVKTYLFYASTGQLKLV
ncbi:UvrD-helicase domain-containing protein [Pedobacter sp. MC2016-14]|uniref:UvrD-helicase domain-containing protein n=1 Tax=Pedobacter sp. MC2016-14 TaxID=2897327 RepID=UPI001E548875|nr:UvrD-helicase domain-containing protein [Pedobacter sp. MC2016-14]MCD0487156.1 UvrD-helicase domain-containing protein [Pedobacter sp. MC2016-14]